MLHLIVTTIKILKSNHPRTIAATRICQPPAIGYKKRKDCLLSEIKRLETRTTQLEEQHKRLASKPSALEGAKKEHENLGRDAERFLEYIAKLQEAKKKSEKFNEALK
ncbi:hypothetical protein PtA15_5A852 [Puccinia triticina]|uniref:Uncharacterized protein n=1 Tax=Puccinia triticina TaxID=208348 RepID=A0ABY7CMS6_9BASI|nr:uncharacterized protein PtA15_5A852 [Puccinia triticina]WAQ85277.1 hypothetical protein PtA15_5A852 [Puccinia triticina]